MVERTQRREYQETITSAIRMSDGSVVLATRGGKVKFFRRDSWKHGSDCDTSNLEGRVCLLPLGGSLFAVGDSTGTVALYQKTECVDHVKSAHGEAVSALAVEREGIIFCAFASGGLDGAVILWRVTGGLLKQVKKLPSRLSEISALLFLKPARSYYLYIGTTFGDLTSWLPILDIVDRKAKPAAHAGSIIHLAQISESYIASAGLDAAVRIWGTGNGLRLVQALRHSAAVCRVLAFDDTLATGTWDGRLTVWQRASGQLDAYRQVATISLGPEPLVPVQYLESHKLFVCNRIGSTPVSFCRFDGQALEQFREPDDGNVGSLQHFIWTDGKMCLGLQGSSLDKMKLLNVPLPKFRLTILTTPSSVAQARVARFDLGSPLLVCRHQFRPDVEQQLKHERGVVTGSHLALLGDFGTSGAVTLLSLGALAASFAVTTPTPALVLLRLTAGASFCWGFHRLWQGPGGITYTPRSIEVDEPRDQDQAGAASDTSTLRRRNVAERGSSD